MFVISTGPIRASIIKYPIYVFGRSLLQNPAVEQKIPEEETCAPLSLPVPPANPAGQRPVRGAQFIPCTALTLHAAVWGKLLLSHQTAGILLGC